MCERALANNQLQLCIALLTMIEIYLTFSSSDIPFITIDTHCALFPQNKVQVQVVIMKNQRADYTRHAMDGAKGVRQD